MRIVILAVAAAAMLLSGEARAQKIHAVLVGDTLDGAIGAGVKANLDHIEEFLQVVQRRGEVNTSIVEVRDHEFSCNSIRAAVLNLKVSADDVILFYYAGHGFRTSATPTKFPDFDCRRTESDQPVGMSDIVSQYLESQKARLVVAIADACNKEVSPSSLAKALPLELAGPDLKFAIQRLFLEYRGVLLMAGSVPGELSWFSVAGDSIGGYFSNQFMGVLYEQINERGARITWQDITAKAERVMAIPTNPSPTLQHPHIDASQLQLSGATGKAQ